MPDFYFPVVFSWPEDTEGLSYAEKGRLVDALVMYARGQGDYNSLLVGTEKAVFPMFRNAYDRNQAKRGVKAETSRENGRKGGRPRKTKETQENPVGFYETQENHNNNINRELELYSELDIKNNNNNVDVISARDEVMAFATGNLQYMGPRALEELQTFRDELPDDVILYGLNAACDNGVRNWAYARSILNSYVSNGFKAVGDVKAAEERRKAQKASMVSDGNGGKIVNPALNFQQRDNSDYSTDVDNSWMGEFMPTGG